MENPTKGMKSKLNKHCININRFFSETLGSRFYAFLRKKRFAFYFASDTDLLFVLKKCELSRPGENCLNPVNVFGTSALHACFYAAREKIIQAKQDGLINILPWVLYTGKDPHELKLMLGKSLWAQIARNSLSRNKLILRHFLISILTRQYLLARFVRRKSRRLYLDSDAPLNTDVQGFLCHALHNPHLLDLLKILIKLRSSILVSFDYFPVGENNHVSFVHAKAYRAFEVQTVCERSSVPLSTRSIQRITCENVAQIIDDTYRMARLLNIQFTLSSNATLASLTRRHDHYAKTIALQRIESEPLVAFTRAAILAEQLGMPMGETNYATSIGTIQAKVILDSRTLAFEGLDMHHCVASFQSYIKGGEYLVVSGRLVESDVRFTMGLWWSDGQLLLDQIQGMFNKPLEKDIEWTIIRVLLLDNRYFQPRDRLQHD